jgi:hypothetical protein
LIDTITAPYEIARTSIPPALVMVKSLTGVPSGIAPKTVSVTPAARFTTALPDTLLAQTMAVA